MAIRNPFNPTKVTVTFAPRGVKNETNTLYFYIQSMANCGASFIANVHADYGAGGPFKPEHFRAALEAGIAQTSHDRRSYLLQGNGDASCPDSMATVVAVAVYSSTRLGDKEWGDDRATFDNVEGMALTCNSSGSRTHSIFAAYITRDSSIRRCIRVESIEVEDVNV